jgi:hypothetical protein
MLRKYLGNKNTPYPILILIKYPANITGLFIISEILMLLFTTIFYLKKELTGQVQYVPHTDARIYTLCGILNNSEANFDMNRPRDKKK